MLNIVRFRQSVRALFVMTLISVSLFLTAVSLMGVSASQGNSLSNHWLSQEGCYRDELNQSDIDYYNCWTDNAGKILTMSMFTGDQLDAGRSFGFIQSHLSDYYLPELVVNSSITPFQSEGNSMSISNRIVEITATNNSNSIFNQLAVGTSYTGNTNLAYVGADRVFFQNQTFGNAFTPDSSSVYEIPGGFSKQASFDVLGNRFEVFTNATLASSDPFVNMSIQVKPVIGTTISPDMKYVFLQIFNTTSTNPFYSGGLYAINGTYVGGLPFRGSSGLSQGGIMLSYSNATSVFTTDQGPGQFGQDAVAVKYGSNSIYDYEHWANDVPFGHSWFGPGYSIPPQGNGGGLSQPIYAEIYPILHFDSRLANETVKYIASNPLNMAVSPPVSFGFDALGMALYAKNNPQYLGLAEGFWNYYYSLYNGSNYPTAYARSVDTFALAGFKLYGCNSTVEKFTRNFLGNSSGASIEEYGWGTAALYQLKQCTGAPSDVALYNSFLNSYLTSNWNFLDVILPNHSIGVIPGYTFQYGEAASGLLLGGVPYNNPVILEAMNAVYQSNMSGALLNQPYHGDLANTETIPAYLLSTYLFQNEMKNETNGYWITGIQNANVTSIDYYNGTLLIGASGNNGFIQVASENGSNTVLRINGTGTYLAAQNIGTVTTTIETTSTFTSTIVSTTTLTTTVSEGGTSPTMILEILAVGLALGLAASAAYFRMRKK